MLITGINLGLCQLRTAVICRGSRSLCPGRCGGSHIFSPFFTHSLDVVTCALQFAVLAKFNLVPFGILDCLFNSLFAKVCIFQNGFICFYLLVVGFLCLYILLVGVKFSLQLIVLFLPAIVAFGLQFVQFLLNVGQLFCICLVLRQIRL